MRCRLPTGTARASSCWRWRSVSAGHWPAGKLAVEELEPFCWRPLVRARHRAARCVGSSARSTGCRRSPTCRSCWRWGRRRVAGYNVLFLYGLELAPATGRRDHRPRLRARLRGARRLVVLGERSAARPPRTDRRTRRARWPSSIPAAPWTPIVAAARRSSWPGRCAGSIASGSRRPRVSRCGDGDLLRDRGQALMLIPLQPRGARLAISGHGSGRLATADLSRLFGTVLAFVFSTRFAASGPRRRLVCPADSDLRRALVRLDPR